MKERYEELKDRLAYYLLLQVYTFLNISGSKDVDVAMRRLTEKAAEINIREAQLLPEEKYGESLGHALAKHMGEAFNSKYEIKPGEDNFKVVLEECGCINSILKNSSEFGFDDSTCRYIFCGACMGGYRLSAEKLGLKFKGSLTPHGCSMAFISMSK